MVDIRHYGPTGTVPDEPAVALFQKQWQLYRKFVDNNLLYHREAYDFPETNSRWHSLGHEAGFDQVRELFVAPTDLFRMYCFQA